VTAAEALTDPVRRHLRFVARRHEERQCPGRSFMLGNGVPVGDDAKLDDVGRRGGGGEAVPRLMTKRPRPASPASLNECHSPPAGQDRMWLDASASPAAGGPELSRVVGKTGYGSCRKARRPGPATFGDGIGVTAAREQEAATVLQWAVSRNRAGRSAAERVGRAVPQLDPRDAECARA